MNFKLNHTMLAIAQGMACIALAGCGGGSDGGAAPGLQADAQADQAERQQWADVDAQQPTLSVDATPDADPAASGLVGLSGQVADNLRVSRVTWSNDRGGNGTAALALGPDTTNGSWSIPSIQLLPGENRITVTAEDAAGNAFSTTVDMARAAAGPGEGGDAAAAEHESAQAVATPLLGTTSVQPSADSNRSGTAEAFVYTAQATGTPRQIHFYLDSGSTATRVVVGIFYDSNGSPGSRLSSSVIDRPKAGAWNSVTLSSTRTITQGRRYWIALLTPPGYGTIRFRDRASGGSASVTSRETNLTWVPWNWAVGARSSNSPASAYVVATPSPSPSPSPSPPPPPPPPAPPPPPPAPPPPAPPPPAPAPAPAPAASASLSWTRSSDTRVTGYRVYFGTASRSYLQQPGSGLSAGSSAAYTVTGLQTGRTYYFAVTSVDGAGNESTYSNEATKVIP